MALRVLLADESPTIKKVMQISLQDFGIELKTVQLGIDVLQVTEQFQPEIIFCDVLLQKKSGYEVAQEIKANRKTQNIPVVLMWSGFMELDEEKFKECGADGQIEKPFDSNALRETVKRLVNSTQGQGMSDYLDFPEVTFVNAKLNTQTGIPIVEATPPPPASNSEPAYGGSANYNPNIGVGSGDVSWNMDSFEDIQPANAEDSDVDGFAQKPLQPIKPARLESVPLKPVVSKITPLPSEFSKPPASGRSTGPQGISLNDRDSIPIPEEEELTHSELLSNVSMHPSDIDKFNIKPLKPQDSRKKQDVFTQETYAAEEPTAIQPNLKDVKLTQEQLELIIRAQSKEIIEKIVWKLVPEIADKIIKEEIHRLMDETKL